MICPKEGCGQRLYVTHTYKAGSAGTTRRLHCKKCHTVVNTITVMTVVNPEYGKGAGTVAKKAKTPADLLAAGGPAPCKPDRAGVVRAA